MEKFKLKKYIKEPLKIMIVAEVKRKYFSGKN